MAALPRLPIDLSSVAAVGQGNAADFAHQFHISFSSLVQGSCIFSGQPYHCAATHFQQDSTAVWTPWTRVPHCDGCLPGTTLPFDHCRRSPDVVDVGELVDYPRRDCFNANPPGCIDPVEHFAHARVFVFQGTHDDVSRPGTVENTVALLAQMIEAPAKAIKLVNNLPFAHVLPVNATPFFNQTIPAGYDGPGACLRHVFESPLHAARANASNWLAFDQSEFAGHDIGFAQQGWLYLPERCRAHECKLVVMAARCAPPTTYAPAASEFAAYAEGTGIVLLQPCVGGHVDRFKYPHASDVASGSLDVFGQLSADYVRQSSPHMHAVGEMVRRLTGVAAAAHTVPTAAAPAPATKHAPAAELAPATERAPAAEPLVEQRLEVQPPHSTVVHGTAAIPGLRLPSLHIDNASVATAGCSNTGDFAHQLHVAFSSLVTSTCAFSSQPFHCAATRFAGDYLVPKTASTAAGIHCPQCPPNGTLIYDHCKNHPHWVDVDVLAEYAEAHPNVDDPKLHLAGARAFVFHPTHDRCYLNGSMHNVASFYQRYTRDASQVKYVGDQPFRHVLPTNGTAYFNSSTPAGYDGPGECLRHVFGHASTLQPAAPEAHDHWHVFDQTEFLEHGLIDEGMSPLGWLYLPPACEKEVCKLLILPSGCIPPFSGVKGDAAADAFARYAYANNVVILRSCAGAPIDTKRFPDNKENRRGMVDVYGQLGADYATQIGGQMRPIGKMIKRLMGVE